MKRNDTGDFEFIKDKFEKSFPATPDSLSEDAINQLLSSKQEPKTVKLKPKFNYQAFISVAACLVLFSGIIYAAYIGGLFSGNKEKTNIFEEYNTVYAAIDSIVDRVGWMPIDGRGGKGSFSQTSDKDESVQEPDIIKTDGEYVYHVFNENSVHIFKVNDGETELVAVIDYKSAYKPKEQSESFSASVWDLYVYKDRLILGIGIDDSLASEYKRDFHKTITQIYDISNKSAPKLISEFEQSGERISSQMIGDYLYTASYYYAPEENGEYSIPVCGRINKAEYIPVENISIFEDSDDLRFLVVSAIDVEEAKELTDSKAVLGATDYVFFSDENLYITSLPHRLSDKVTSLDIIKAGLNGGSIELSEKASVEGEFDYGLEIAEENGFTVIFNGRKEHILLFNEALELVGKTEGFKEAESVVTFRFVDDLLYVATVVGEDEYKLKLFDLADSQQPTIKCSIDSGLRIEQIIPVNEDMLLCLGENGGIDAHSIILYDVSDKSDIKLLDYEEYYNDNILLETQSHFIINAEKGYLAIPSVFVLNGEQKNGAVTVEIADGKIEITNQFVNESFFEWERWIYIGDYLYCFDEDHDAPIDEAFIISAYKYE